MTNSDNTLENTGIELSNEAFLKECYEKCGLNYWGLDNHGSYEREKIEDELGLILLTVFKADLAKKTKTGRIKKSEFKNPNCYKIEIQKPESWFQAKYNN